MSQVHSLCPDQLAQHLIAPDPIARHPVATVPTGPSPVAGRRVLLIGPGRADPLGHGGRTLDLALHLTRDAASFTVVDIGVRGARRAGRITDAADVAMPAPPDLVIADHLGPGAALAVGRLARRHGARLLLHVHDLRTGDRLTRPMGQALTRRALAAADRVVVPDTTVARAVAALGVPPGRIVRLPAWAPIPDLPRPRTARLALGWPARGVHVVAVDLDRSQDVALVAEATRRSRLDAALHDTALHCTVVTDTAPRSVPTGAGGSGSGTARFVRRDDLPAHDVDVLVAAADILVLAQDRRHEDATTTAVALLHRALGAGRPVVVAAPPTSRLSAAAERAAGAVAVVPPGDAGALATTVVGLADRTALRTVVGRRARAFAELHLDPGRALAVHEEIIATLLTDGATRI